MLKNALLVVFISWLTYIILGVLEGDTFDTASLDGKNVIVTGASSGIGEQMAYHYARYGANVFITARREHLLKQVVDKCEELGVEGRRYGYLAADMSLEADRIAVLQNAETLFEGDLDQLILNHAHFPRIRKWTGSVEDIQLLKNTINVNLFSFVQMTAEAFPSLQRSGGAIAVLGSIAGRFPSPLQGEYTASKFALDGFYSALRQEFKSSGQNVSITFCTIGVVWTDSAKDVYVKTVAMVDNPSETIVKLIEATAGIPDDTARAIISATTRRAGELYYPGYYNLRFIALLRALFPEFMETTNIMPLIST